MLHATTGTVAHPLIPPPPLKLSRFSLVFLFRRLLFLSVGARTLEGPRSEATKSLVPVKRALKDREGWRVYVCSDEERQEYHRTTDVISGCNSGGT